MQRYATCDAGEKGAVLAALGVEAWQQSNVTNPTSRLSVSSWTASYAAVRSFIPGDGNGFWSSSLTKLWLGAVSG